MDIVQITINSLSIIVSILTFVLGLIFIFKPASLQKLNQRLGKKFLFVKKSQTILDKETNTDEWIINNSKIIGVIFVILALVVLLQIII